MSRFLLVPCCGCNNVLTPYSVFKRDKTPEKPAEQFLFGISRENTKIWGGWVWHDSFGVSVFRQWAWALSAPWRGLPTRMTRRCCQTPNLRSPYCYFKITCALFSTMTCAVYVSGHITDRALPVYARSPFYWLLVASIGNDVYRY